MLCQFLMTPFCPQIGQCQEISFRLRGSEVRTVPRHALARHRIPESCSPGEARVAASISRVRKQVRRSLPSIAGVPKDRTTTDQQVPGFDPFTPFLSI